MNEIKQLCETFRKSLLMEETGIHPGRIITLLRMKSRITQEKLASKAGVCTQTIKRLESGRGSVSEITCYKIFEALGVDVPVLTKALENK
ncbi:helix-turn-helix domain-containing protein [Bacillus sp. Marseille-Q1617]|uniref:helix-turn-helix domain-containing protein n=1 Tax=Bacillus sp. Marseille-Q1617 TaxID=2736887 RepID=UPI00158BEBEE|nr:helix-turn-helix transcriptional regulator [Bacillus sp. Marseille-Q1617]